MELHVDLFHYRPVTAETHQRQYRAVRHIVDQLESRGSASYEMDMIPPFRSDRNHGQLRKRRLTDG
jgi:hypothetical protein